MFWRSFFYLTLGTVIIPLSCGAQQASKKDAGAGKGSSSVSLTLSRKAPPDYEKRLKPLLTPLKDVLARRGDLEAQGKDGIILLDESIMYTDAAGKRLWVNHVIEEAANESGAETLAEKTHEFRTDDQKIHLVAARSILPDGRQIQVEDSGVIMESAQNDAGDSVYGDRGQMRIIFSAMKPGIVREVIICGEEKAARIPGHFTAQDYLGAYWPERHARLLFLMPESVATRVRETKLGAGIPEVVKSVLPDGTHLWKYEKERIAPDYAEGGRPPIDQMGPAVFLTTLPDWETFGAWYRKLLKERSTLPEPLLDLARQWTKDAKTDAEKVQAIVTHVARDVRYTGLEFGLGALQPRSPEQVWKTAYGDCKDKSNLSALLLRAVGVEAHLALIQTEHLGRVEKRSPDTRHFNHAIVAVKSADGWQFTDPTIRYVTPGMLAPSSCDRDVLLMKPEGIEWTRTPASPGGEVHYHLDADFEADGSIEGWLELRNSGYYLAAERSYYESMGQDELKRDVQQTLGALLPGARLIDVEKGKLESDVSWRVFFTLPTRASGNDERLPVVFPAGGAVMMRMGEDEKRQTTRFVWPITWRVSGSIRLPEGWVAADVPSAFDFNTDVYDVSARWEVKNGACLPHFEARVTRSAMAPKEHGTAWRGTQSLLGWLQKPLWLQRGDAAAAGTPAEPSLTLGKFPLMPTGEGQLAFVEERYPTTGNRDLRRLALRKVLEHFADDPLTAFMAKVRLALVDWDDDKNAEAEKALREINQKPHTKVDEDSAAWGRYMHALVLAEMDKAGEAAKILEAIARKPSISEYRRAWAFLQLSYMHEKLKDLTRALAVAREGMALDLADAANGFIAQIAFLLIELKQEKELAAELKKLVDAQADKATPQFVHLAKLADAWARSDKTQHAEILSKALKDQAFTTSDADYDKFITSARAALAGQSVSGDLQKQLKDYLAQHPAELTPPATGWPADKKACEAALTAAEEKNDSDAAHRLGLRLLTEYPPDAGFSHRLWRTASYLEHHERGPEVKTVSPLLRLLVDLGKQLPWQNDDHWEMRFIEGTLFEYRGQDWRGAAEHFTALDADDGLPDAFRTSTITRAATNYERLKDWKKAADMLARLERWKSYSSSGDGLARAAHLYLELRQPQEALRLLRVVAESRDYHVKNSAMAETLKQWLDLTKDEKSVLAFWQAEPKWWPAWQALAKAAGITETPVEPMVVNADSLGQELNDAVSAKDVTRTGEITRRIVHQARWIPGFAVTSSWVATYRLASVQPKVQPEIHAFILAILRDAPLTQDNDKRSRFMYLAISGIDSNKPEQALQDIHEYFKIYPQDTHGISFVMSRLWAVIATGQAGERPAAIARLREHLASPELRDDRMRSVRALMDLLRADKNMAELKTLLAEEVKHPAFSSDEKALAELKQMLRGEGETEALAGALQRWMSRHSPPWWDYAGPKTLADTGLKPEDEEIETALETLPFQEQLKALVMAAAERPASLEQRLDWWRRGLHGCLRVERGTREDYEARVMPLLDDPEAPLSLKNVVVKIAALFVAEFGTPEDYQKVRQKLEPKDWSEYTQAYMACLDRINATDLDSNTSVAEALLAQVKENNAMVLIDRFAAILVTRALRQGKVDRAEAVTLALTSLRNQPGIQAKDLQTLRLRLMKEITGVKRLMPLHTALEKAVAENLPAGLLPEVKAPETMGGTSNERLGAASYIAWMRQAIGKGSYDRNDTTLWVSFGEACAELNSTSTLKLRKALAQAAFTASEQGEDEARSEAVSLIISFIDTDSPEERDFAFGLLKPWRDPKLPETYAEIRTAEAHVALRNGSTFDFDAIKNQLKDAGKNDYLQDIALGRSMARGDVPGIKRALDDIGPDALVEHHRLVQLIPALKKAGRQDELALALEEAEVALKELVLRSWTGNDIYAVRQALTLADLLGKPEALPAPWVSYCQKAYAERQDQLFMTIRIARMKKDWPAMLEAATEMVKKYPTFYANTWYKARALVELGREEEAKEPLRVYVKYCHDEADHFEASALLKKIEAK